MTSKRKHVTPEINADEIYDYLLSKSLFDKACQNLFETFQGTGSYKYLKNIGLNQISTATEWNTTPYEEVQKKARMHYDKIRLVTSTVEDDVDRIIKEKFNGPFRSVIKQEILKFINEKSLLSDDEDTEDRSDNAETVVKIEVEDEGNLKDLSLDQPGCGQGNSAQNESYLDDISLGSPSSVHTSDLSSFEDEISISSDEEGTKRVVSLKFAEEELKRCKENKLYGSPNLKSPKKEPNSKILNGVKLEEQFSDSQRSTISPRRIRKPNSKYFSTDVLSSLEIDPISNATTPNINTSSLSVPRKRGRPRKYDKK